MPMYICLQELGEEADLAPLPDVNQVLCFERPDRTPEAQLSDFPAEDEADAKYFRGAGDTQVGKIEGPCKKNCRVSCVATMHMMNHVEHGEDSACASNHGPAAAATASQCCRIG